MSACMIKMPKRAVFEQNLQKSMVVTINCICFRVALAGVPVEAITSTLMLNPLCWEPFFFVFLQSQR